MYIVSEQRMKAMQDLVGSRKSRPTLPGAVGEVRTLRRGRRLELDQPRRAVLLDSGILIEVARARDASIVAKWLELMRRRA
jgi:hypothetical protein